MNEVRVLLNGADGRMGCEVFEEIERRTGIFLGAAVDKEDPPYREKYVSTKNGDVLRSSSNKGCLMAAAIRTDVVIDFSTPEAAIDLLRIVCKPAVIGVTGFSKNQLGEIEEMSKKVPIVQDYNFSTGVCIMTAVAEMIAHGLGVDCDVDILEAHHGGKMDAPSGTAIKLAKAVARGRGQDYDDVVKMARVGRTGARPIGEIGIQALRLKGLVGEHKIYFADTNERIELTHKAGSRAVFAQGAVMAAKWVVNQPPGLYTMKDVLGL